MQTESIITLKHVIDFNKHEHTDLNRLMIIITNFSMGMAKDVSNRGLQLNHIITVIKKLIVMCLKRLISLWRRIWHLLHCIKCAFLENTHTPAEVNEWLLCRFCFLVLPSLNFCSFLKVSDTLWRHTLWSKIIFMSIFIQFVSVFFQCHILVVVELYLFISHPAHGIFFTGQLFAYIIGPIERKQDMKQGKHHLGDLTLQRIHSCYRICPGLQNLLPDQIHSFTGFTCALTFREEPSELCGHMGKPFTTDRENSNDSSHVTLFICNLKVCKKNSRELVSNARSEKWTSSSGRLINRQTSAPAESAGKLSYLCFWPIGTAKVAEWTFLLPVNKDLAVCIRLMLLQHLNYCWSTMFILDISFTVDSAWR